MTELLYLKDSYLREFEATVQEVAPEEKAVVLDKTIFYVAGGGQPTDTGKLYCNGKEFLVKEVCKKQGKILHNLLSGVGDFAALEKACSVKGALDWERRYKLMRMHSSAHVLAGVIFNETGKLITGNQIDVEQSRMDFNVENYSQELLQEFVGKANEVVARNLEQKVSFLPREEALKIPSLFRLKDVLPKDLQEFRIVSIGDFDIQADGGTHVRNTSEIGRIKIVKTENKGADNRRIYWVLE